MGIWNSTVHEVICKSFFFQHVYILPIIDMSKIGGYGFIDRRTKFFIYRGDCSSGYNALFEND